MKSPGGQLLSRLFNSAANLGNLPLSTDLEINQVIPIVPFLRMLMWDPCMLSTQKIHTILFIKLEHSWSNSICSVLHVKLLVRFLVTCLPKSTQFCSLILTIWFLRAPCVMSTKLNWNSALSPVYELLAIWNKDDPENQACSQHWKHLQWYFHSPCLSGWSLCVSAFKFTFVVGREVIENTAFGLGNIRSHSQLYPISS